MTADAKKTEAQWLEQLTPEQFHVCRERGTERPFTGNYWNTKTPGTYHCVACGQALFDWQTKFDSGTGWPSFHGPLGDDRVVTETDTGHGMIRTEVSCSGCGSHLGHIFEDGPPPTGLRYCLNSVALDLRAER